MNWVNNFNLDKVYKLVVQILLIKKLDVLLKNWETNFEETVII